MSDKPKFTRYDVVSELNPAYLKTGSMADYYGIYKVCRFDADGRIERTIAIISGKFGNTAARREAYRMAAKLSQ